MYVLKCIFRFAFNFLGFYLEYLSVPNLKAGINYLEKLFGYFLVSFYATVSLFIADIHSETET
jgi:hypothetical protein